MKKLTEYEWDGLRMARCCDCGWAEQSDGAVSKTSVTRAARLHAQTAGHRLNISTVHVLQLVPMKYGDGKWHSDGKRERYARLERRAANVTK